MKKIVLLLVSILTFTLTFAQSDKRLKGLEKELNQVLKDTKAAGFAVAIVEADKMIYSKGFGYRDNENKIPVDANTLFAIGSCSKAFTSALLGLLRNENKLSFNDSPIKHIPDLKFYNNEMNNTIIIKDLMSHRTGLPRHDFSWYLFPTTNKDSLLHRVEHQEPFTGVRQQWYYNNFMFLAQGIIAERITNKSWEDNIKARFFKPLGMKRSNLSIDELKQSENVAIGYELKKDSIISKMDYYKIAGMSPAGSINSSANEMSKWVITWINKGQFNGKEILPETYINEAISSQMVISGGLPDNEFPNMYMANYGYGWMMMSYRGHYRVEHGGAIDGFTASTSFFPTDKIGIVVLANQNGSAVPGIVRNIIADRMLKTEKTDWLKRFNNQQKKAKNTKQENNTGTNKVENTKPSHIAQEYTGNYKNLGYGKFNVFVKNDSLFAKFPIKKLFLKHYHYDIFEPFEVTKKGIDTSETGPIRFNFETNDAGEIASVKIKTEATLDPIKFKRTPNTIAVDKNTLEKYTGVFELAGMEIKVYIKNNSKLYLFVAGQPEYELLATDKHKFSFKTLDGFKVEFIETEDKSINTMTLYQPNGTFKTKRKN